MVTSVVITLGLLLLTQIMKKYIAPKWGDTGVHAFIFVIALIVVAVRAFASYSPSFLHLITLAGEYLAATITGYEVLLKQLGVPSSDELNDTISTTSTLQG